MNNQSFIASIIVGLAASLLIGSARCATMPDLQNVTMPNPEPTAQTNWDVFTPPVTTSPALPNTPLIAEWTRTGASDDTLVLTGDKLSSYAGDDEGKDTQFLVYGQTTNSDPVQSPGSIQRLDGLKVATTLPIGLPPWSTYFLWPKNSVGYGYPIAINHTDTWWLSSNDGVTRGDVISVYGRNLSHGGGTTTAWVYLKPSGKLTGLWAVVISVNPYRIQFTVPTSLDNGTYEVWVHNGHGGRYGWSGPLSLTITDVYSWNGSTFNVRDYGAKGDGATDDADAIQLAYAAALSYRNKTGLHPTLYFPSGVYMTRSGIAFEHDCRYLGDGINLTVLRCNQAFNKPGDGNKVALMVGQGTTHDIEVKDMTLDANNHFGPPTNTNCVLLCAWDRPSPDIRFTRVRIQMLIPGIELGCAFINSAQRLSITSCEFIGGYLFLLHGNECVITGSTFLGANDSQTAIFQWDTSNLSITNCRASDYEINSSTGQGQGRLLTGNGAYGTQRNVYVADNITSDYGPRAGFGDGNTGEQVMCEGNWTHYEGIPVAATKTTVSFRNLNVSYIGQIATIHAGKGVGQYRQITGYDSDSKTITVNPVWNVVPDESSSLLIVHAAVKWVFYHNTFDGKDDFATRPTASSGIQPFGGSFDWIGDSNTITNMRIGLYVVGLQQTDPIMSTGPCYFNYYANNHIQSCYRGVYAGCGVPTTTLDTGTCFLGNVFTKNRISDIVSTGVGIWRNAKNTPGAPLDLTLFEHNTFTNLPTGVETDVSLEGARIENIVLYKNTFNRGTTVLAGSTGVHFGMTTLKSALNSNVWIGFDNVYSGTLQGPALEVLIRTNDLTAESAKVQATAIIRNAGTTSLTWNASSNSAWLTLSPATGVIANENSISTTTLTCNPEGLSPGTYLGTVTITGASQTKKLSLTFTVGQSAPNNVQITVSVS